MNIPNIVVHQVHFQMKKRRILYFQSIYKMKIKMITFSQVAVTTEVDIPVIMIDMAVIDMVVMIIYILVDTIVMMTINILVDTIVMMIINIQVNIQLPLPTHQPPINGQVHPIPISIPLMMMTEEIDSMIKEIVMMTNIVIYLMIGLKDLLGNHHFSKKEVNQKLVSVKVQRVSLPHKF